MALAVDSSSPARWSGAPADNVDITSAAFTPPTNALIVVCVATNSLGQATVASVSDSQSKTWVEHARRNLADGNEGHASIWSADGFANSSMTISVRRTNGSGDPDTNGIWVKAYVITGEHSTPFVQASENSSGTNNLTASLFTSTHANSFAFVSASEWNALGAPTSSDLTIDAFHQAGFMSGVSGFKDLGTTGAETANLNAGGSGTAAWNWVAIEVREATSDIEFSGALLAPVSTISGNLSVIGGFSGSLLASVSTIAGVEVSSVGFSGALQAQPSVLTSNLSVLVDFSGALAAEPSTLASQLLLLGALSTANVRLNWQLGGRRLRIYMGPRR